MQVGDTCDSEHAQWLVQAVSYSSLVGGPVSYVTHDTWVSHDERVACAIVVLESKQQLRGALFVMSSRAYKFTASAECLREGYRAVLQPFAAVKSVTAVRIEFDSITRAFVLYITQKGGGVVRFADLCSSSGQVVSAAPPASTPSTFGAWTQATAAKGQLRVVYTGLEPGTTPTTFLFPLPGISGAAHPPSCSFDHALVQYPIKDDKAWGVTVASASGKTVNLERKSPLEGCIMCNGRVFLITKQAIQCLPPLSDVAVPVSLDTYKRGEQGTLTVTDCATPTSPRSSERVLPHMIVGIRGVAEGKERPAEKHELRRTRFDRDSEVVEVRDGPRTVFFGYRTTVAVPGLTADALVALAYTSSVRRLDLWYEVEQFLVELQHQLGPKSKFHPLEHTVDVAKSLATMDAAVVAFAMQVGSLCIQDVTKTRVRAGRIFAPSDLSCVWIGSRSAADMVAAASKMLHSGGITAGAWPILAAVLQSAYHRCGALSATGPVLGTAPMPLFEQSAIEACMVSAAEEIKMDKDAEQAVVLLRASLEHVKGACLLPTLARPAIEVLSIVAERMTAESLVPSFNVSRLLLHDEEANYSAPSTPVAAAVDDFDDEPMSPVEEVKMPVSTSPKRKSDEATVPASKRPVKRARMDSPVVSNVHLTEPVYNKDGNILRFALEVLLTRYLRTMLFNHAGRALPDWDDGYLSAILVGRHAAETRALILKHEKKIADSAKSETKSRAKPRATKRTRLTRAEQAAKSKACLDKLNKNNTFSTRLQAAISLGRAFVTSAEDYNKECEGAPRDLFDGHLLPHEALSNLVVHLFPKSKTKSPLPSKSKLLRRGSDAEDEPPFKPTYHSPAKPDDDVKKSSMQPGLLSWLRTLVTMKHGPKGEVKDNESDLGALNKTVEAVSSMIHPYMIWLLTSADGDGPYRQTVAKMYDIYRQTYSIDRFGMYSKCIAMSESHRCYWEWYRFQCHPDTPCHLSTLLGKFPTFLASIQGNAVFRKAKVPQFHLIPQLMESMTAACLPKCAPFSVSLTTWLSPAVASWFLQQPQLDPAAAAAPLVDPLKPTTTSDHTNQMMLETFATLAVYVLAERKPVPALADIIVFYDNIERAATGQASRSPRFRSPEEAQATRIKMAACNAAKTGKEAKVSTGPAKGDRRSQGMELCAATIAQVPVLRLMQRELVDFLAEQLGGALDLEALSLDQPAPQSSRFDRETVLDVEVEAKQMQTTSGAVRAAHEDAKHPWHSWLRRKHLRAELGAQQLCAQMMNHLAKGVEKAEHEHQDDYLKMTANDPSKDVNLNAIVLASPSVLNSTKEGRTIQFFANLRDTDMVKEWCRKGELQPFHRLTTPGQLKNWRTPELLITYRRYYLLEMRSNLGGRLPEMWRLHGQQWFTKDRAAWALSSEQPTFGLVAPPGLERFQSGKKKGAGTPAGRGRGRESAVPPPLPAFIGGSGSGSGSGAGLQWGILVPPFAAAGSLPSGGFQLPPHPSEGSPVAMLRDLPASAEEAAVEDEDECVPATVPFMSIAMDTSS